ncbi:hypothetical protein SALBM217S_04843 [Streptomyces griseoloalbus]
MPVTHCLPKIAACPSWSAPAVGVREEALRVTLMSSTDTSLPDRV